MINVSDAFKEELNNGNRVYLTYATITLTDGTRLTITNEQIWSSGVKIEESVSDSSSFSIGSAIASKLTLTLNNGYGDFTDYIFDNASVNIQVGLELPNGTIERVNKGYYIVTEATGQNTSLVTLECLDYMYKFNKPYSEVETVYPSTMGSIIRDICTHCGVTLTTTTFPRYDFLINERPNDEALSCLDVVSYISQIACCFARMNNSGQLMITWYDTNDVVVPEKLITKANGDYVTTKSGDYIVVLTTASDEDIRDGSGIVTKIHRIQHTGSHTIQLDDVVITGVRVSIKRDDDTVTALAGSEGYVLGVEENPFIQEGFEGTIADLIGERCIGMKFRPLSVTTLSDPTIEAGDRMYFISPIDNAVYISYITSNKFAISDWQEIKCDAETPARNSATKYGAATKSFVALRKMVQNEKTSRELALEELSTKVDNASGLYMTAEEQPDGSFIYYQHDKPTIAESSIIWKETAETRSVSTDGGQTWNAGITADGDAIVRLLQAEGINADWINAGTLVIRDNNNNIIFSASKDTNSVFIGAGGVTIGGYNNIQRQSVSEALDSVKNYSDLKLTAYSQQVTQAFNDIQAQLDGQVESWYYNYDPTMNNAPASEWTTEKLKQEHEGDTFTNIDTGQSWRFVNDNNTWQWKVIADTAAAAALLAAQQAQATADNKIRNFMVVPTPPYEEGDLWIKDDGTILFCINEKKSGQVYNSNDWEEKVKYTDDTVANQALEEARKAQALNIVLSNEYDSIPTDANGNYTTFPSGIQTTIQTYLGHNDITTKCTYTVTKSDAVTGTWNVNTKTYIVTALSADTGWVDITATYLNSLTATKRFTIAKVKQGIRGVQGNPGAKGDKGDPGIAGASGRVYIIEPSCSVLSRSAMGDITPDAIVWKAYYRNGDEARQTYAGRFKIEESEDGSTWTTVYTSSENETSCSYATRQQLITKKSGDKLVTKKDRNFIVGPHVTASIVRCTLYQAGGVVTILDQQSTSIIEETAGLTVILSNEAVSVTANSDGKIPNYSECFTNLQVYYGNKDVTDYASFSTPIVSSGLSGTWDKTKKRYSVNNLSHDDGYVDFTVSYKNISVTRRFTISKSKNGVSMVGTTELYALNNSSTTPPADSAFTEGIKTPTSSNKYLWNMERIDYSDGSSSIVDKHIVAMFGETGATGNGIRNIVDYYAINNSTTAPADNSFSTTVKTATASNKYLWNYETIIYSNGTQKKTDKRIIGTYGDKGDSATRYYLEFTSKVLKIGKDGVYSPTSITVSLRQVTGNTGVASYFNGRLKIVEWKGSTQKVIRNNTAAAIETFTYTPSEKNIDSVKFEMYNYVNGSYNLLDQETVQCMLDFNALSQEDVFNVLTNNGEWQGIYKEEGSGDYFINFSYAKGGEMALGGLRNVNGSLKMYDADNQLIGSWTYAGLNITKGSISLGKDEDNNPITTISNNGVITTSQLNATAGTFGDLSLSDSSIRYNSPQVPTSISDHKLYIGKHGFSEEGFDESYVESTHYEYYRRVEIKDGFFAIYARTKSSSSTEKELIRISGGYEDYPKFEIRVNDYNTSDTDNPTFLEGNYQDLLCTFGNLTFKSETRMSGWHGIKVRSPLRCFSTLSLSGLPTGTTGGYLRITKTDLDPESYSEAFQISYSSSSSKRYKNVGRLLTNNDIEKAYNIEVRMAKYKKGYLSEDDERCGKQFPMFIAEQMEEFLPDAVDHNSNGLAETWNDRVIIPIMFQMLKSQKEEIEELKKQINHLN